MLTCEQAAQLASKSMDRDLSWREALALKVHLLMCQMCSRYSRQLRFMRKAMSQVEEQKQEILPSLSAEARERIRKQLTETGEPTSEG